MRLRRGGVQNPIRIVDIGCGTGFVIRWLASSGSLGDDVELMGVDFNVALLNEAQRLAAIEKLRCKFAAPDAITIALTVLIVSLMLGLEYTMGWLRSRGVFS